MSELSEQIKAIIENEPVLLDEREPLEAAARDRHLKVVAAAGPVLDRDLRRIGERVAQKRLQCLRGGHGVIVAVGCAAEFFTRF